MMLKCTLIITILDRCSTVPVTLCEPVGRGLGRHPVTVESLPGRRAASGARRAGLEVVEKVLTSSIHAANRTACTRSSAQGIVAP
jgi:hypothetical protein